MGDEVADLIEQLNRAPRSPERAEERRRSFTYGNVKLENPTVTRELVDRVADKMPSE